MLALILALIIVACSKRRNFNICNNDFAILSFTLFTTIILFKSPTQDSFIEISKFLSYLVFYFIGRTIPLRRLNASLLGNLSFLCLLFLSAMAITGIGYKQWGHAYTFTGGYYFKTDLAIASLIFLTISTVTLRNKLLIFTAVILSGYLVFKSNARIALPLVLIIPAISINSKNYGFAKLRLRTALKIIAPLIIGVLVFALIDFKSLGMLGFDFSDPFSAANTQGRTVIWSAIITSYEESDLISKITGQGLDADIRATMAFSDSSEVEGFRAHNSYLYLLISTGIIGSILMYTSIFLMLSKSIKSLRHSRSLQIEIPTIALCLIILFISLSLTTEIVIRAQLMIPLFLFSGASVKIYLRNKRAQINAPRSIN